MTVPAARPPRRSVHGHWHPPRPPPAAFWHGHADGGARATTKLKLVPPRQRSQLVPSSLHGGDGGPSRQRDGRHRPDRLQDHRAWQVLPGLRRSQLHRHETATTPSPPPSPRRAEMTSHATVILHIVPSHRPRRRRLRVDDYQHGTTTSSVTTRVGRRHHWDDHQWDDHYEWNDYE